MFKFFKEWLEMLEDDEEDKEPVEISKYWFVQLFFELCFWFILVPVAAYYIIESKGGL